MKRRRPGSHKTKSNEQKLDQPSHIRSRKFIMSHHGCCSRFKCWTLLLMMMPLMAISRMQSLNSQPPFNFTWPAKKAADMEGDLILGGLMMIHERQDDITCGPVMPQGGIQALETMLFTIDQINPNLSSTAGFTIGAHILDDCDKDTYGLEQAVAFIKGSISNIDDTNYKCIDGTVPDVRNKVISGVVGASSSVTSIQVANLLRLFKIPQVSFFSSSPELSNKQRFEYFTRTIPSDHHQVMAIVQMIRFLKWSYISILYEESTYGIKAFEELEVLLAKNNICIAVKERLVKDSGVAGEAAYNGIVHKLNSKPKAKGVIIFGSDQEVSGVMRAVRRNNLTANFNWIGSDGWAGRLLVSEGNEPEVEGTLAFLPQAHPVRGFDNYFLSLTPQNNKRNPWFIEFWENHFQCRYPSSSPTPYNQDWDRTCTGQEQLTPEGTEFEGQLQYVSDAVMAFANAFKDMHQTVCHGRRGLCKDMVPIDGSELLKYLRRVEFTGLSGDRFQFDEYGDGPARYDLIHFKQVSPGRYRWQRIGEYHSGQLKLDTNEELRFRGDQATPPESICSHPCNASQAKKYVEGEGCCWTCVECVLYQIRNPDDETQCFACPLGTLPNVERSQCLTIPEVYLRPDSGWAIGAMSFSAVGIALTFTVLGVFLRHNDTPVVRASGRELSYVLLSGILLCYMVSFLFVLRPTDVVCGVQQTAIGLCFSVVYAALFTKTNRIARIFRGGKKSAGRPGLISPKSQLAICGGLVAIQGLILLALLWVSPSVAKHVHPTREDNLLVCSSFTDASYMMAFAYPILLILLCTVYAVVTRKIPAAFNESKYIGFTMYTTCVIWLAFVPIYFSTASHLPLRITSMSVTISLSATVTLACLFSPKLYIIIFHPERNVRQALTMPTTKLSFRNKKNSNNQSSNNGTNKTESAKGLSTSSAVQNQLSPTSQQIQSQLPQTENDQEENEGDLTVKMMSTTGTITVSRIQLKD
ncbi:metabotropic glutamate receptor 2-like [Daphnia pulex]|uniref:metabotropic glutamate receptor 2-like n=1 Tax=Daphnia pulex TaxID=6669 RepID=UPI001EE05623|nr:metabotropic glutamate receptor 2-like [Daphnia pulex]XP_046460553.1 metabotropic glutamate receptor 2-like [Daphnia pulex]XP_046460554.1 metabotropic glutamate receptor 2-like [Daphnia pulex]